MLGWFLPAVFSVCLSGQIVQVDLRLPASDFAYK